MGNVSFLQLATSLDYLFYNDRQDASLIAEFASKEKDDENMTALDKGVLKFYLDKIHTVPASFDELLGLLIDKKSEMCNKEFVKVIFSALCVSSKGLNEEDIKKILEDRFDTPYANAEFSYLRKCFKGYFSQLANGNFVIGNAKIKDAIYKYYSKEDENCDQQYACGTKGSKCCQPFEIQLRKVIEKVHLTIKYTTRQQY